LNTKTIAKRTVATAAAGPANLFVFATNELVVTVMAISPLGLIWLTIANSELLQTGFERARLYSLRKNSIARVVCIRARVYSCRKSWYRPGRWVTDWTGDIGNTSLGPA
jgi:hypothetical protein